MHIQSLASYCFLSLQMRYTSKVSVWPVGLSGYLRYESPIVTKAKVSQL